MFQVLGKLARSEMAKLNCHLPSSESKVGGKSNPLSHFGSSNQVPLGSPTAQQPGFKALSCCFASDTGAQWLPQLNMTVQFSQLDLSDGLFSANLSNPTLKSSKLVVILTSFGAGD